MLSNAPAQKKYRLQADPEIRDQQFVSISILNTTELLFRNILSKVRVYLTTEYPDITQEHLTQLFYEYISKYTKNMLDQQKNCPSIKVRGVFEDLEDASDASQDLKSKMSGEPVDMYVVEVGKWVGVCSRDTVSSPEVTEKLMNYTVYSYGEFYREEKDEFDSRVRNRDLKEKTPEPLKTLDNNDNEFDEATDYLTEDPVMQSQKYAVVSVNGNVTTFAGSLVSLLAVSFTHSYITDNSTTDVTKKDVELTGDFSSVNCYQPCFKVRGGFISEEDARKQAKSFQITDSTIDTLVARIGVWLPVVVPVDGIETEYDHSEMNTIRDVMKSGLEKATEAKMKMKAAGYNPEDHTKDPNAPKPDDSKLELTVNSTTEEELSGLPEEIVGMLGNGTEDARLEYKKTDDVEIVEL
jgi:hypothetical protein